MGTGATDLAQLMIVCKPVSISLTHPALDMREESKLSGKQRQRNVPLSFGQNIFDRSRPIILRLRRSSSESFRVKQALAVRCCALMLLPNIIIYIYRKLAINVSVCIWMLSERYIPFIVCVLCVPFFKLSYTTICCTTKTGSLTVSRWLARFCVKLLALCLITTSHGGWSERRCVGLHVRRT